MKKSRLIQIIIVCFVSAGVLLAGQNQIKSVSTLTSSGSAGSGNNGTNITGNDETSERVDDKANADSNTNADISDSFTDKSSTDGSGNSTKSSASQPEFTPETTAATATLIETEDYTLNLIRYTDLEYGNVTYEYELVTDLPDEEIPHLYIEGIVLNDEVKIPGNTTLTFSGSSKPGNRRFCKADNIMKHLLFNEGFSFERIGGTILDYGTSFSEKDRKDIEFSSVIPEMSNDEYLFSPFMDALASTQTICENDNMKVRLLGCGADGFGDYMHLVVECENISDGTLPFYIEEIVINGTSFSKVTGDEIGSGQKEIFHCNLSSSALKEQNIPTIYDLQLVLLMDSAEDKSIENETYRGGQIYPVELALKGEKYETTFGGKLIYEDDLFQIYFLRFEADSVRNRVYCIYTVNNKSDEYISFNMYNEKADGKECSIGHNIIYKTDFSYTSTEGLLYSVAPGCNRTCTTSFENIENCDSLQKIECDMVITTVGGAEVLDEAKIVFGN